MLAGNVVSKLLYVSYLNFESGKLRRGLIPSALLPLRRILALAKDHLHGVLAILIYKAAHCNGTGLYLGYVEYSLAEHTERRGKNGIGIAVNHICRYEVRYSREHAVIKELVELKVACKLSCESVHHELCNCSERVVLGNGGVAVLGEKHKDGCGGESAELLHTVNVLKRNRLVVSLVSDSLYCEVVACSLHHSILVSGL